MSLITGLDLRNVPVEELAFAMAVFLNAARLPSESPSNCDAPGNCLCRRTLRHLESRGGGTPEIEGGKLKGETTLDFAFHRLWQHYERDVRQWSICARVLGFHLLMVRTEGMVVERWMAPSPGSDETVILHPAVVEALAVVTLDPQGYLPETDFLRTLESLAPCDTGGWYDNPQVSPESALNTVTLAF